MNFKKLMGRIGTGLMMLQLAAPVGAMANEAYTDYTHKCTYAWTYTEEGHKPNYCLICGHVDEDVYFHNFGVYGDKCATCGYEKTTEVEEHVHEWYWPNTLGEVCKTCGEVKPANPTVDDKKEDVEKEEATPSCDHNKFFDMNGTKICQICCEHEFHGGGDDDKCFYCAIPASEVDKDNAGDADKKDEEVKVEDTNKDDHEDHSNCGKPCQKHYCADCGDEMNVESTTQTLCPDCAKAAADKEEVKVETPVVGGETEDDSCEGEATCTHKNHNGVGHTQSNGNGHTKEHTNNGNGNSDGSKVKENNGNANKEAKNDKKSK